MIFDFIRKIKKKRFFINILTLVSGSALAQIIGIFLSPIISRLYSPESFGILGFVIATSAIITTIGSLKLETAIVLEKNDRFASAIQNLCFKILGLISILFIIFLFLSTYVFDFYKDESKSYFIWFAVPIMIGKSILNIFKGSLNRKRNYKLIASSNVVQKLATNLTQILFGFLGAKAIGLITGNFLGIIISLILIILSEKNLINKIDNINKIQRLLLKKHYKFPLYSAPQNVLNAVSQQLPIYLLGYFYGTEVVGYYWFAIRLIQIPSRLISNSIRQVFFKEATVLKNDLDKLKRLYFKLTKNLALIIFFPAIIFFFTAPWLFNIIFGEQWIMAGNFARWMILWLSIGFINPPSVILFDVFNNQNVFLKYEVLLSIFRALSLLVGGYLDFQPTNTIVLYSIVGVVFNSILIGSSYFFNIIIQKKSLTS